MNVLKLTQIIEAGFIFCKHNKKVIGVKAAGHQITAGFALAGRG